MHELVTSCDLLRAEMEVMAEQAAFLFPAPSRLTEENRRGASNTTKHTAPSLHAAPCAELRGRTAEPQRKFPLSAKLQMEDLPMEILAGGTFLA